MNSNPFDVTVIVRTCARDDIFLRRALASIVTQTRPPTAIAVVDDGDDRARVDRVFAALGCEGLTLLHLARDPRSQPNRAAALNRGVAAAKTRWIAFLDDDDTWAPQFLEHVADTLARGAGRPDLGGVVTQTEAVYERLRKGRLVETGREPFNPWLDAVDLAALAVETQFTLNALVVSRDAVAEVGKFREDLPMQEDWEFNVRVVSRFQFDVIAEPLARYHQRPLDDPAANTSDADLRRAAVKIHNEWLREDLAAGRIGLGQLSLVGEMRGHRQELARWTRWRRRIAGWLGRPIR